MTSRFLCYFNATVCGVLLMGLGCSRDAEPIDEDRYAEPDRLFNIVEANVLANSEFDIIVDIDHSRLAADAGSPMPPAHVLIWSNPELEAAILKLNPLAAVDLPMRILAFENQDSKEASIIVNSYDYLANRYSLPEGGDFRARYDAVVAEAIQGIPDNAIARFSSDKMPAAGLVTLDSPFDFATTEKRLLEAIKGQSDTVMFGSIDFAERSKSCGVNLSPLRLILFGGPGPGGRAMKSAPTLGLDAFCQKLLIWQDNGGKVHVTFNDLLALATRQQVSGGLALKVINNRIKKLFTDTLKQ